jgi:hypothetical protein
MMKKILLTLMLVGLASGVQSDEVFQGSQAAEILIGNTLEANYRPVGECGKKVFYEYYDQSGKIYGLEKKAEQAGSYTHYVGTWSVKDGKLCTSVYGRLASCTDYIKVDEDTYKRRVDGVELDNVKVHPGKYRPCF